VVGSELLIAAIITVALGVIADLIRINRILIEDSLEQQKRERFIQAALPDSSLFEPTVPAREASGY
jgi:hypothetical protein